jgi:hypothetical protein
MNEWSPIVSEFDSAEAAEAYDLWLRAKVADSLADDRPVIAHDQVMAEIRSIIATKRDRQGC